MDVSVCICTWNRAELLHQTLAEMRNLRIPDGVEWELILVNNNSTDHTETVIARHADALPIRSLVELKQGLAHARNCAIEAAGGDLIVWTDDDVLVAPGWLEAYLDVQRRRPDAAGFGGKVEPWFEETPPAWLEQNLDLIGSAFALRDLGDEERVIDDPNGQLPYGANMAFKASELRKRLFDTDLGHRGTVQAGGEETDVFRRMIRDGLQVVWVPGASVKHFLPKARATLNYLRRFYYDGSRHKKIAESERVGRRLAKVPLWLIRRSLACEVNYLKTRLFKAPRFWIPPMIRRSACRGEVAFYYSTPPKTVGPPP